MNRVPWIETTAVRVANDKSGGKHASSETKTTSSGKGGAHRADNWAGGSLGNRLDRPHNPDGWQLGGRRDND